MAAEDLELFPTGTASNEALRAELKRWFSMVSQSIHSPMPDLKLHISHFAKLLAHTTALYHPTIAQRRHNEVLHRSAANLDVWTADEWKDWCQTLRGGNNVAKARLNLKRRREEISSTIAEWRAETLETPSPQKKRKRTPFTLRKKPSQR